MWILKEPSCTFEFSGSNTAFYSRSLTTTQETKKFMAPIEVPWRLQIDKPDQWRGHHRGPFQRKKFSVLADGGWSERHSTYISWLSVKKNEELGLSMDYLWKWINFSGYLCKDRASIGNRHIVLLSESAWVSSLLCKRIYFAKLFSKWSNIRN